jgi:hypothetical protein
MKKNTEDTVVPFLFSTVEIARLAFISERKIVAEKKPVFNLHAF